MSEILMLANPRRRRRRARRNPVGLMANPRRRARSSTLSAGGGAGAKNVWTAILPVGIGVGIGLATPKFMKLEGVAKWIVPVGIGLAGNLLLRGVIGSRTANLFSAGVLSSVVLFAMNEIVFKKQGINLLSDAERVVSLDDETVVMGQDEVPELSDAERTMSVDADEIPELSAEDPTSGRY